MARAIKPRKQEIKGKKRKESLTNAVLASKGVADNRNYRRAICDKSLVIKPIMREKVMSVLTGDIVQAKNFQRTQNNVNKIVGRDGNGKIGATS